MSRYRPPREKSSAYITPEGQQLLQSELKELWKVKRPEVTRKVSEAAAMGDRSENAEYIYGKKQLREIDGRIQFLAKRLDKLVVVDRTPPDPGKVYFGAWVTLRNVEGGNQGDTVRYRLVGPDEFDREPGFISIDAPVARLLLGKSVGDEVELTMDGCDCIHEIIVIDY
ncbi:MAG: transcription elongation factor GreB [Gammaproteobacteria bacterium]|nr:transcription elongation factor GreB [Gammaproteobacteria bacterium]